MRVAEVRSRTPITASKFVKTILGIEAVFSMVRACVEYGSGGKRSFSRRGRQAMSEQTIAQSNQNTSRRSALSVKAALGF